MTGRVREHWRAVEHVTPVSRRWPVTPDSVVRTWKLFGAEPGIVAALAIEWQKPKREVKRYFAEIGLILAAAEEDEHASTRGGHGSPWMRRRYGLLGSDKHARRRVTRSIHHAGVALRDYGGMGLDDHKKSKRAFSLRVNDGSSAAGNAVPYVPIVDDFLAPLPKPVTVLRSRDADDEKRRHEMISTYGHEGLEAHETLFGLAEEPMAYGFTVEMLYDVASPKERELLDLLHDRTFAEIDRIKGWTHGYARTLAKRLERKAKKQRAG